MFQLRPTVLSLALPLLSNAGLVEEWNAAVGEAIKADSPPPALAARNLAVVHLSMLRADSSPAGAHNAALHATTTLFPSHRAVFHSVYTAHPAGSEQDRTAGRSAAQGILAGQSKDNATTTVHYVPKTAPGQWRRTAPKRPPETPHWPRVTPFLLECCDQFRPIAPPKPGTPGLADAKYHHNYWRPATTAHHADPGSTGNSLLESQPHPDYVSGHSTFSGAAATVLTHFFPEKDLESHARSDTLPDHVRIYSSFHECAKKVSDSRIWGGIHFPFACDNGLVVGSNVGKWCLDHAADLRSR